MERETVSRVSVHGAGPPNALARAPFTSGQWAELEHQALIFKYMMAGVNVPSDLLNPIRKSVAALGLSPVPHHPSNAMGWGTFHLGVANNTDPEPGRCRRTDGKKWRCSRDVVPDQKYCERHMHRGRHRSRKPGDNQSSPSSQASGAAGNSSSSPTAVSVAASRGGAASSQGAGGGAASALAHSNLRPTIAQQQQGQSSVSSLAASKSYGGGGQHSMNLSATGSAHFSLPMHSSSATSAMASSRYTHLGTHIKQEVGMGAEQMLFSEASGSTRGLVGQQQDSVSSLSMLPHSNMSNNPWRSMSPKVPPAPQPKAQMLQYPQMRSILGQDLGFLPDSTQQQNMSMAAAVQAQAQQQAQQQAHHQAQHQQAQQQASFGGGYESMSVGRGEPEGQPLRHFFDDWPRSSRDPQAALSWSDVEDERSNGSSSGNHNHQQHQHQQQQQQQQHQQQQQQQHQRNNNGSSNTQLSISIPMGDHRFNPNSTSASAAGSPPRERGEEAGRVSRSGEMAVPSSMKEKSI